MLYNQVLEEPNILSIIVGQLSVKDTRNLILSNGDFTHEPRFKDTVSIHMLECKRLLDKQTEASNFRMRTDSFVGDIKRYIYDIESFQNRNIRKRLAITMFDFVCENKDLLELPLFSRFKEVLHSRLIVFIRDPVHNFRSEGTDYLDRLFDTKVRTFFTPGIPHVEYILDLNGERQWI